MRKIALQGLIGRKRETLLLWTVVVLAFLFLALPTTLITSIEATDATQRKAAYGNWQVMASGLTGADAGELSACAGTAITLPMVKVSGADYFQGDNTYFFSTWSPELKEMGSFQLREGRWPESPDEVAVEYAKLVALGLDVGDDFSVQCALELPMEEEHAAANREALEAIRAETRARLEENCLRIFRERDWELLVDRETIGGLPAGQEVMRVGDYVYTSSSSGVDILWDAYLPEDGGAGFFPFWTVYYEKFVRRFCDVEHPEGQALPLEELNEEQFQTALGIYIGYYLDHYARIEEPRRTGDLVGLEDFSARLDFTDGLGASGPMDLKLIRRYTICGVFDTYTDHWDSGRLDLPSGFITEESYRGFVEGQRTVVEKYPIFQPLDFENIVLLQSGADASALWREAVPVYNGVLLDRYDFAPPIYQARGSDVVRNDFGMVLSTGEVSSQITFSFVLADSAAPRRSEARQVEAWLIPPNASEGYRMDRLLSEEDGVQIASLQGLMEHLSGRGTYATLYTGTAPLIIEADMEGALVAFDLDGRRYEIALEDFLAHDFTVNGLVPALWEQGAWMEDLEEQSEFASLRLNRLAYPPSAETNGDLLALVMVILFVTTVCAVFQICFTQIRRRLRRIVLLKSVGAETGQIAGMMFWEFFYFWIAAAPLGTALGLLAAYIASLALGGSQGRTILLSIEPGVLAAALLAGTAALALGMAVPAVMAVGVPLTGRTVRKKPLPPPRREVRQDFLHVTLRGLTAKKGRTAGTFALCVFMMSIALLCLFLGFRMLGDYRDTVIRDGRPDYLLRAAYAMNTRQREEYLAELEELGVCAEATTFFSGGHITLERSAWEGSPLLTAAAGDGQAGYPVTLHAVVSTDPVFARLQSVATVGKLDPDAFDRGEQALVFLPLYRDTGRADEAALASAEGWERLAAAGIQTSFYAEYDGAYSRDGSIQVGDELSLSSSVTRFTDGGYSTSTYAASASVGAIVYFFPDQGVWPLSDGTELRIVASPKLLKALLPNASTALNPNAARAVYYQQTIFSRTGGNYGATEFYINSLPDVSPEEADTTLLVFARNHYLDIEVYRESSEKLLRDAVNNILLVCLLGLTAVLLALVIFFNTISSDLEQERCRIGILQSLGVSDRLFVLRQLALGLAASLTALVLANALLWGGTAVYVRVTGAVLENLLWGYPAGWHAALSLFLAAVLTLLFLLPMGRLRRYLPVENIRTRK